MRAMRRHVGSAVALGRDRLERIAVAQARIVPFQRHHIDRFEGVAAQRILEAERPQHLHGIRPNLQPGTNLFEFACALVDLDGKSALPRSNCCRQTPDAGSDNDYLFLATDWHLHPDSLATVTLRRAHIPEFS